MRNREPHGPFCQSCGMPMEKPEDFGTGTQGLRIKDYCHYCVQNGSFTEPTITMQGMIDKCVTIMAQQGTMEAGQARALMVKMIPQLKRWKDVVKG